MDVRLEIHYPHDESRETLTDETRGRLRAALVAAAADVLGGGTVVRVHDNARFSVAAAREMIAHARHSNHDPYGNDIEDDAGIFLASEGVAVQGAVYVAYTDIDALTGPQRFVRDAAAAGLDTLVLDPEHVLIRRGAQTLHVHVDGSSGYGLRELALDGALLAELTVQIANAQPANVDAVTALEEDAELWFGSDDFPGMEASLAAWLAGGPLEQMPE